MEKLMSVIVQIIFLRLFLNAPRCLGSFNSICIPSEREALLQFKNELKDPSNRLKSWVGDGDCCKWYGVICNNFTGNYVMELHLQSLPFEEYDSFAVFGGEISSSLLNLKELRYLDLSNNDFGGIQIPKFLGSLRSLRVLNLSGAGFGGLIPHELGNLSNLHHLNLNNFESDYDAYVDSLYWLSGLSMLEYLDISHVNLSLSFHWLEIMNELPSLVELHLSGSDLVHIPSLVHVNFSSLSVLDLSWNRFQEYLVPNWVFHLKTLKFLNLAGNRFQGPVQTYIQNMNSIQRLDLSSNRFSLVPKWVLSLRTLLSLNLAKNYFKGPIPSELQNISAIKELHLSGNRFNSSIPNWLYNFRQLELLNLDSNYLEGEISSAIGNMTTLTSLDFSGNKFHGEIPKSFKNLCNLRTLSLRGVNLSQDVSDILEILSSCVSNELQSLDLRDCNLFGQLINRISNFNKLSYLHLSDNPISGPIPLGLAALTSLRVLSLSNTKLSGTVPEGLGALESLVEIFIFDNLLLEGNISENHFRNLTRLRFFDGSRNSLSLRVSSDWVPPFIHLRFLHLRGWDVGSQFPSWLPSLKYLKHLDLSNSRISSSIPNWFWNSFTHLSYLNLSHNQIYGVIPDISNFGSTAGSVIDLNSNHLEGSVPRISTNVSFLEFSNNSFSGSISHFLCFEMHEQKQMEFIHFSNNFLSGEIPNCWSSWTYLKSIRLSNNNFSGNIPKSIGQLTALKFLHIRNNSLVGEIPSSLQNCTLLTTLDVAENQLEGHISAWIGIRLSNMSILSLRRNKLDGNIPKELCHLKSLQILDLSHNFLSGNIPSCISNLSSMAPTDPHDQFYAFVESVDGSDSRIEEDAVLMMKGRIVFYDSILKYVKSMDLSGNSLSGEIPKEITTLSALRSLNFSDNFLSGKIPESIGSMRELDALDFSHNHLYGRIPQSITNLTFLGVLNLSYNNLSGRIPTGTQLQTFDSLSFIGNEELCGPPLSDNCSATGVVPSAENGNDDRDEVDWIWYVSIALGFIVGFWSILCPLFINGRWRLIYYGCLDRLWNRVWWRFRCL